MKPAISAAHSVIAFGFNRTAATLAPIAVTASRRRVISSGTEIAEIANTRKASAPPTTVPAHEQSETMRREQQRRDEFARRRQRLVAEEKHEQQKRELEPDEIGEREDRAKKTELARRTQTGYALCR